MGCFRNRMEGYSRENEGLRKKVDYLESTNRFVLVLYIFVATFFEVVTMYVNFY